MSNRNLLILSFITLIIIIAAVVTSKDRAPRTVIETASLFPDLKDRINDIARIGVESAAGSLHLNKQDGNWQISESGNYPARFDKIKQTALAVAEMKILSPKTGNPSLFSELGVEDINAEKSTSRLLTLQDTNGATLASLIVGNARSGRNAEDTGMYIRKPESNETWLVSGSLDLSAEAADWIEQDLLDIADARIMDTKIEHPDGAVLTINRAKGQEDFSVADIPKDKESRSSYFINQIGTILSKLTIEDVKARAGFTFPDTATRTTVRTYDGLVANITTANIEGLNHITLDFSVDEAQLAAATPAEAEAPADEKTQEAIVIGEQPEEAAKAEAIDVRKEVADLNGKTANWVYIISPSKYGLLVKRPDDVLQDKSTEKQADADPETPAG